VILTVDGKDFERALKIEADPTLPPEVAANVGQEQEEEGEEGVIR
jgi:hypothetical protein